MLAAAPAGLAGFAVLGELEDELEDEPHAAAPMARSTHAPAGAIRRQEKERCLVRLVGMEEVRVSSRRRMTPEGFRHGA